jgi:nucleoside 2-deoxyribosyltransferase
VATKTIFIAFAIEDERIRDLLKGQSLNTDSPFEYVDMSVKEPYSSQWKERTRTRIRRSDGVIALISKNTPKASGEIWEIGCAIEEKKPASRALDLQGRQNEAERDGGPEDRCLDVGGARCLHRQCLNEKPVPNRPPPFSISTT